MDAFELLRHQWASQELGAETQPSSPILDSPTSDNHLALPHGPAIPQLSKIERPEIKRKRKLSPSIDTSIQPELFDAVRMRFHQHVASHISLGSSRFEPLEGILVEAVCGCHLHFCPAEYVRLMFEDECLQLLHIRNETTHSDTTLSLLESWLDSQHVSPLPLAELKMRPEFILMRVDSILRIADSLTVDETTPTASLHLLACLLQDIYLMKLSCDTLNISVFVRPFRLQPLLVSSPCLMPGSSPPHMSFPSVRDSIPVVLVPIIRRGVLPHESILAHRLALIVDNSTDSFGLLWVRLLWLQPLSVYFRISRASRSRYQWLCVDSKSCEKVRNCPVKAPHFVDECVICGVDDDQRFDVVRPWLLHSQFSASFDCGTNSTTIQPSDSIAARLFPGVFETISRPTCHSCFLLLHCSQQAMLELAEMTIPNMHAEQPSCLQHLAQTLLQRISPLILAMPWQLFTKPITARFIDVVNHLNNCTLKHPEDAYTLAFRNDAEPMPCFLLHRESYSALATSFVRLAAAANDVTSMETLKQRVDALLETATTRCGCQSVRLIQLLIKCVCTATLHHFIESRYESVNPNLVPNH